MAVANLEGDGDESVRVAVALLERLPSGFRAFFLLLLGENGGELDRVLLFVLLGVSPSSRPLLRDLDLDLLVLVAILK